MYSQFLAFLFFYISCLGMPHLRLHFCFNIQKQPHQEYLLFYVALFYGPGPSKIILVLISLQLHSAPGPYLQQGLCQCSSHSVMPMMRRSLTQHIKGEVEYLWLNTHHSKGNHHVDWDVGSQKKQIKLRNDSYTSNVPSPPTFLVFNKALLHVFIP